MSLPFLQKNDLLGKLDHKPSYVNLGDNSKSLIIGKIDLKVKFQGKSSTLQAFVLPTCSHDIVLGRVWLYTFNPRLNFQKLLTTIDIKADRKPKPLSQRQSQQWLSELQTGKVDYAVISLHGIDLESEGTPSQNAQLQDLLMRFKDIMPEEMPKQLPPVRDIDHRILLNSEKSIPWRPTYKLSYNEADALKKTLNEMLEYGWIEPSVSPYGAPVMLIAKKGGAGMRMVIDYRQLNDITVKNRYPLPRHDEMIGRLHGAKVFSKMDLRSGYYQIRMHPDDIEKTAFRTKYGHFEFKVMPMGLTGAPGTFMGLMNKVFSSLTDDCVLVFMDDILIFSNDWDSHLRHLEQVFKILTNNQLYAAPKKCIFGQSKIEFLGNIISEEGLAMHPQKASLINDWPQPSNVTELRSFIGMVTYYRSFIPRFSQIMKPLTDLLQGQQQGKKSVIEWNTPQENAFREIKKLMISDLVLRIPDPTKPFVLFFDAAGNDGIGGVLAQADNNGILHPVGFESRKLSSAEKRYPTHEQEQLAFLHCLNRWRWYLDGLSFTVFTDNYSTTFLQTQGTLSKRQARWLNMFQSFSYTIKHLPRDKNVVSDALSKRPHSLRETDFSIIKETVCTPNDAIFETFEDFHPTLFDMTVVHLADDMQEDFLQSINEDDELRLLQQQLLSIDSTHPEVNSSDLKQFRTEDGRIYYTSVETPNIHRLYIPSTRNWRIRIMRDCHDSPTSGH